MLWPLCDFVFEIEIMKKKKSDWYTFLILEHSNHCLWYILWNLQKTWPGDLAVPEPNPRKVLTSMFKVSKTNIFFITDIIAVWPLMQFDNLWRRRSWFQIGWTWINSYKIRSKQWKMYVIRLLSYVICCMSYVICPNFELSLLFMTAFVLDMTSFVQNVTSFVLSGQWSSGSELHCPLSGGVARRSWKHHLCRQVVWRLSHTVVMPPAMVRLREAWPPRAQTEINLVI